MKILFPDERLEITASNAVAMRQLIPDPAENLDDISGTIFNQSQYDYIEATAGASTDEDVDHDFGEAVTVNYIFLSRVDWATLISAGDITITISASADAAFTTTEDVSFSFNETDLNDRELRHYARDITFTTSFRYYRVYFASATGGALKLRNIWLGEAFDFGINAEQPHQVSYYDNDFEVIDNAVYTLTFPSVTNAKKVEFENQIGRHRKIGNIVLWDTDNDYFLNTKLVYGNILDAKYEPRERKTDSYKITLKVENGI